MRFSLVAPTNVLGLRVFFIHLKVFIDGNKKHLVFQFTLFVHYENDAVTAYNSDNPSLDWISLNLIKY